MMNYQDPNYYQPSSHYYSNFEITTSQLNGITPIHFGNSSEISQFYNAVVRYRPDIDHNLLAKFIDSITNNLLRNRNHSSNYRFSIHFNIETCIIKNTIPKKEEEKLNLLLLLK